jgi:hypothetical protein
MENELVAKEHYITILAISVPATKSIKLMKLHTFLNEMCLILSQVSQFETLKSRICCLIISIYGTVWSFFLASFAYLESPVQCGSAHTQELGRLCYIAATFVYYTFYLFFL